MKITPEVVVSDKHVLLLPPGLTGEVTTADGTTYNLGPAHITVVEFDSHEHAKEVALGASEMAAADPAVTAVEEHDAAQSRKNLGLTKKKG